MNRAKGGGWEFLDYAVPGQKGYTWNPAAGCSNMNCLPRLNGVCYALKMAPRLGRFCPLCPSFEPHLHDGENGTPDRIWEPYEHGGYCTITPVSMGDLFGLEEEQTELILDVIEVSSGWHDFLLLTKMPHVARKFDGWFNNIWFGVTVNAQQDKSRLTVLREDIEARKKWAIFEPLYSAIDYDLTFLDWIIIGPQTRPNLQPEKEWVQSILDNAGDVPVFMKSTLEWTPKRRESPQ